MEDMNQEIMDEKTTLLLLTVSFYKKIGIPQKEIATIIKKTEPAVSRLVAMAKEKNILNVSYELNVPPGYEEKFPISLNNPILSKAILNIYQGLQECLVVPGLQFLQQLLGNQDEIDTTELNQTNKSMEALFMKAAGQRLAYLIRERSTHPGNNENPHIIMVSWGYTVNCAISDTILSPAKTTKLDKDVSPYNLKVYPVCGDFSHNESDENYEYSNRYSSNENARLLAQKTHEKRSVRSLNTTPLVTIGNPDELFNFRPIFQADRTLMNLYGNFLDPTDRSGDVWRANTMITSVGGEAHLPEHSSYLALGYKPQDQESQENFHFKGNISGLLFNERTEQVAHKGRRFIGLRLEHIKNIADNHRRNLSSGAGPRPGAGIVVIAHNVEKAHAISLLCKNGFINELIISEDIAKAII